MEVPIDEEIKFFDDTAVFIYSTVSSTRPPDLPKEPSEEDRKVWFVKAEPTSPVRDTTDEEQNSEGLQFKYESNLNNVIKTEATSPSQGYLEELSISPSAIPKDPYKDDIKKWFVKTEPASPFRDTTEVDEDPAGLRLECKPSLNKLIKIEASSPQHIREHEEESPPALLKEPCKEDIKEWFVKTEPASPDRDTTEVDENTAGLQLECKASLNMLIKTEATSPVGEQVEESPSASKQVTGSDKSFQSSCCPPTAQLQSDLQFRVHTAHKNAHQCPHCEYSTCLKGNLKMHIDSVHKKIKAFQCGYCKYKTNSKVYMKKHVDAVHKKIIFQCLHCEYSTKWKTTLKIHIDSVHDNMWAFQCPHCEYKTNWKCSLRNHIDSVHRQIWPFQCTQCEYKTNSKNTLKIHIDSVHNNIRPFQCIHCEYKAKKQCDLKIHIDSVHKKVRAFQCPHCDYKTNWKNNLRNHIDSVHTKIRAFHCPHCKHKTNGKSKLKLHIDSVHNKIKAFQCPDCQYKTSWKITLNRHIDAVHNKIRAFKCPHCEWNTSRKDILNKHINSVHKKEAVLKK